MVNEEQTKTPGDPGYEAPLETTNKGTGTIVARLADPKSDERDDHKEEGGTAEKKGR